MSPRPTHTCTLRITERRSGHVVSEDVVRVTVGPAVISDESGNVYDRHMTGAQVGTGGRLATFYQRKLLLETLAPIVRARVRL